MKPKEYLVSIGALPKGATGRGRLSLENKALIQKAVAEGIQIEGYTVSEAKDSTAAPVVSKVIHSTTLLDVPDEAKAEENWQAFVNGNEIGMRTPCVKCSNSLTYCRCEKSRVWVDFDRIGVVDFRPRTSPIPKNRW
jgi:hypothetical protein